MEALESRLLSIRSEFHYRASLDSSASITAQSEVEARKLYEKKFSQGGINVKSGGFGSKTFLKMVEEASQGLTALSIQKMKNRRKKVEKILRQVAL